MELFGVPDDRPRFVGHLPDRCFVQGAHLAAAVAQGAAELNGAGAAFLEGGVVEEGVRVGVQDLVAERGRLGGVDGMRRDGPILDAGDQIAQAVEVHRLVEAVADRLVHQRMVRDPDIAAQVLGARHLIGEDRSQQIIGPHPEDRRRHLLPAREAENGERARRVPAPARAEHRRRQHCLRQHLLHRRRLQEAEDDFEGEAVLLGQRDHQAVVGGGRLQLDVEAAAEALPERKAPRAVDPRAERRVQHQLHPAALVEEALGHHRPVRRHGAQWTRAGADVGDRLLGTRTVETALLDEKRDRVGVAGSFVRSATRAIARRPASTRTVAGAGAGETLAEPRHLLGQLACPPRRLPQPERHRRRRAMRILDPDPSRLDPPNPPRRGPQQEDVARQALDGEVLVNRPDRRPLRFRHHQVVGVVRDRAAGGNRRQARAAPSAHHAVHPVAVQPGAMPPARRCNAVRQHRHHLVEHAARQVAVRVRAPHQVEQPVLFPVARRRRGDDLLRQHVARPRHHCPLVKQAPPDGADECGAFDQLVARRRKEAPFRNERPIHLVAGTPDPLQRDRDRAGRTDVADQIDRADVDAELE